MSTKPRELPPPGIVPRWSANPTTNRADRVRVNQRRHRQRVKDRITALESRLTSTQQQLEQALAKIEQLTADLRRAGIQHSEGAPVKVSPQAKTFGCTGEDGITACPGLRGHCQSLDHDLPLPQSPQQGGLMTRRALPSNMCPQKDDEAPPREEATYIGQFSRHVNSLVDFADAIELGESGKGNPFPKLKDGESAMLCRDAYKIITGQKGNGLDEKAMVMWLRPGFRSPNASQDGCRVETGFLFSYLDHLNPL
ncbi:hypothetical protein Micbo1qcDRAFT_208134 [Microdochium bolleyi]|uniref:BZIP domain-containing protein n=1 Tax=Microdochium bolleyi TaxID=196109 RepID=A0A136IRF1_9PEZI|nr:hypothetical protein Micbo1qcDRAFT_208134 [Microdochium bolleyi]